MATFECTHYFFIFSVIMVLIINCYKCYNCFTSVFFVFVLKHWWTCPDIRKNAAKVLSWTSLW